MAFENVSVKICRVIILLRQSYYDLLKNRRWVPNRKLVLPFFLILAQLLNGEIVKDITTANESLLC